MHGNCIPPHQIPRRQTRSRRQKHKRQQQHLNLALLLVPRAIRETQNSARRSIGRAPRSPASQTAAEQSVSPRRAGKKRRRRSVDYWRFLLRLWRRRHRVRWRRRRWRRRRRRCSIGRRTLRRWRRSRVCRLRRHDDRRSLRGRRLGRHGRLHAPPLLASRQALSTAAAETGGRL